MTLPSDCSVRKAPLVAALLWLVVMACGCQTPLHQYPTEWPELVALSADGTELNGIYGNEGTLITEAGDQKPIKLTSLIPARSVQAHSGDPITSVSSRFAETKTVSLKVRNPSKESGAAEKPWSYSQSAYATVRKLEFSSDVENGAETVTVEGTYFKGTDKQDGGHAIQYHQGGHGGSLGVVGGANSVGVWLTKSADGSLVAAIEDNSFLLFVIVPMYEHALTWARFPRIGD